MQHLKAREIYQILYKKILLCYEEPLLFCHRHIVASWLETELGIIVPEVAMIDGHIIEIERNNQIKEDYKRLVLKK